MILKISYTTLTNDELSIPSEKLFDSSTWVPIYIYTYIITAWKTNKY